VFTGHTHTNGYLFSRIQTAYQSLTLSVRNTVKRPSCAIRAGQLDLQRTGLKMNRS